MTSLEKLSEICRSWGGRILHINKGLFKNFFSWRDAGPGRVLLDDYSDAPFTSYVGVNHKRKTIYIAKPDVNPGEIVHEMGHVFATNKAPEQTEEWVWFGWEFALARKTGCIKQWMRSCNLYQVGTEALNGSTKDIIDFGGLNVKDRRKVLLERLDLALHHKLITSDLEPLSVRIS